MTSRATTTRARALLAAILALPIVLATIVFADLGGVLLLCAYGVPGLILVIRRPGLPIGWLLLLMALGLAIGTAHVTATLGELAAGTADLRGRLTAWANGTGWALVFVGFTGLALVFPSGSMPAGTWGRIGRLVFGLSPLVAVAIMGGPVINVTLPGYASGVDVPNPIALPLFADSALLGQDSTLLWAPLGVLAIVAVASLAARFRVSVGLERLQYRWLAWALVLVILGSIVWAVITTVMRLDAPLLAAAAVALTYPAIPIAIVVAVLRYRLFEIDRLVSRTMGWGIATAMVAVVFVAGVLGLQAVLSTATQGQTLAVAASTLLALVAFQPVRSRVQRVVDRRFDRPRLEAQRVIAAHGERMQHEMDLRALVEDVEGTTMEVLRPSTTALWIRRS